MPYQDLNVGMFKGPLAGNPNIGRTTGANPVRDWVYKGDKKGRQHYKNMNFKTALAAENPFSRKYEGFKTSYPGADKTNMRGYAKQGLTSLLGQNQPGSNISGGTTGSRYLYEKAARLGKFAGRGVPVLGNAFMVGDLAYQGTNAVIDTTDNWGDGETHTMEVYVSVAGVATFKIDGNDPTVNTGTVTFDAGDVVTPWWVTMKGSSAACATIIQELEVGLQ